MKCENKLFNKYKKVIGEAYKVLDYRVTRWLVDDKQKRIKNGICRINKRREPKVSSSSKQ
jgi:hypothetical protein